MPTIPPQGGPAKTPPVAGALAFVRRAGSASLRLWAPWLVAGMVALQPAHAGIDESLTGLQQDWDVVRFRMPTLEREKRYRNLSARAHPLCAQ